MQRLFFPGQQERYQGHGIVETYSSFDPNSKVAGPVPISSVKRSSALAACVALASLLSRLFVTSVLPLQARSGAV
jgi:hypothetical protein